MLTLIERIPANSSTNQAIAQYTLPLTADERQRSRHRFITTDGTEVRLHLPRGTVLQDGDLLKAESEDIHVQVLAKPEPVLTVTAHTHHELLRAAYHLGNRHVPLEIQPHYLRLAPDTVLADMLQHMHLHVTPETAPFQPETGAYASGGHSHHHNHDHEESHE